MPSDNISGQSLRLAPATAVGAFYYLNLVWALALGYLIWGDVPTAGLLIGSAIVVGSGFFLFWREARLQRSLRGRHNRKRLNGMKRGADYLISVAMRSMIGLGVA